jgi:hypothetical protein
VLLPVSGGSPACACRSGRRPTPWLAPRDPKTFHLRHAVRPQAAATLVREDVGEASFLLLRARDRGCPHFRGRESLRPVPFVTAPFRTGRRASGVRRSVGARPRSGEQSDVVSDARSGVEHPLRARWTVRADNGSLPVLRVLRDLPEPALSGLGHAPAFLARQHGASFAGGPDVLANLIPILRRTEPHLWGVAPAGAGRDHPGNGEGTCHGRGRACTRLRRVPASEQRQRARLEGVQDRRSRSGRAAAAVVLLPGVRAARVQRQLIAGTAVLSRLPGGRAPEECGLPEHDA